MNKQKAIQILKDHNEWRRGSSERICTSPSILGQAIDEIVRPNEILENIHYAALNWPQFLGDVECGVLNLFCSEYEYLSHKGDKYYENLGVLEKQLLSLDTNEGRMFMLFVVEALL